MHIEFQFGHLLHLSLIIVIDGGIHCRTINDFYSKKIQDLVLILRFY